jgi:hypothetical protein
MYVLTGSYGLIIFRGGRNEAGIWGNYQDK